MPKPMPKPMPIPLPKKPLPQPLPTPIPAPPKNQPLPIPPRGPIPQGPSGPYVPPRDFPPYGEGPIPFPIGQPSPFENGGVVGPRGDSVPPMPRIPIPQGPNDGRIQTQQDYKNPYEHDYDYWRYKNQQTQYSIPRGEMPQVQNGPMDIAAQIKKKMLEKEMGQGNYPNVPYR